MVAKVLKELILRQLSADGRREHRANRRIMELLGIVELGYSSRWAAWREIHAIIERDFCGRLPHFDWHKYMTPIEKNVWDDLRLIGLPFVPQYPVGNFFADFADPAKKIIIECDGKAYHDKHSDAQRDLIMEEDGWTVFRLPGDVCCRLIDSPCVRLYPDQIDCIRPGEEYYQWMIGTSEGFCQALKHVFYGDTSDEADDSVFHQDAMSAIQLRCGKAICHG